eukprot:136378_1
MALSLIFVVFIMPIIVQAEFPVCDEERTCSGATFTCPYYKTSHCPITCTGYSSCVGAIFYCPPLTGYSCSLDISGIGSASSTEIYATDMVGGTLDVIIHTTSTFSSAFEDGIIHCPISGTCNINITGEGLLNGYIYATQSKTLNINIQSADASLDGASIYCPDNGYKGEPTCVLTASVDRGATAWDGAKIYAVEGFASDLSISCSSSFGCGALAVYCGTAYKYVCTLSGEQYKLCDDISHICNSWLSPTTASPTPPTQSPTPKPTPSPVFSREAVYIDPGGTDESICTSLSPCQSIDYAYACIMGTKCEYSSAGTLYIGKGEFPFYGQHTTSYGDLVLKGQGSALTSLYMNYEETEAFVWFGCYTNQCWIGLDGLTLYSDRTPKNEYDAPLIVREGTLHVRDVVFDGQNFESRSYYQFSGATIIFENCTFTHLNGNFEFLEGATGLFKECVFTDNNITQTEDYASTVPLITVDSSQITFIGCVFAHNYLWRPWITIATKSHITFNHTTITSNYGIKASPTALIVVDGTDCSIEIVDSHFSFNSYFIALIALGKNYNELWIDNVTFNANRFNQYDINSYYSSSFNTIEITNSRFLNGLVTWSSVSGYPLTRIAISDTIWDTYAVESKQFYLLHFVTIQNQALFSGIQMQHIRAIGGIYFDSYDATVSLVISDSTFYNLSTLTFESTGGFIAVDGDFEFTQNHVSYAEHNIISIHSMRESVALANNTFAHNTADYILDYDALLAPGTMIYFDANVFIANDGGIFHLMVNDSSEISIRNVVIRDYINPQVPLFVITSDEGTTCASEATFSLMNIANNHNTQIISTTCTQVHMDTLHLVNNTMPLGDVPYRSDAMFLFEDYSSNATVISNVIAMDNEGIMIQVHAGITIRNHNVTNQSGIYLYNSQGFSTTAYYVNIMVQQIQISNSRSMFNQGLLYIIGTYKQIGVNHITLNGVYLYNNTGSMITIKASTFDAGVAAISHTCPMDITDANIQFLDVQIEDNHMMQDSTYLIGLQGARAWFNDDVSITNNDCGSPCLLLLDGWYTLHNAYYMGNDVYDDNIIRFGHGPQVTAYYDAQLCINSTTNPLEVETYLDYWNIDTPPSHGEKIYFYPCQTFTKSDTKKNAFLHEIGANHSQYLDYSADGAHILQNTVCNETDCEVSCTGSVACFGSRIHCNSGICNVNCSAQYSCANIEIYSHEPNASVSIICDGSSACSSALIKVYNASEFRLICGETSSCLDTIVYLSSTASQIYCNEYESCDSITVNTSRDVTVFMFQYSSDITIETPTGYISDPDTQEENLVCGDPEEYVFWDSDLYSSVEDALTEHYKSQLPCGDESVTFYCSNVSLSNTTESCLMGAEPIETKNYDLFACYPLFVASLMDTYCDGTCPNSPTSAPTTAPSFSPTEQTISPTNAPSVSPTSTPSIAPTVTPTTDPTFAPSNAPIPPPTLSPTVPPTIAPSLAPTIAPSLAPSLSPSIAPSPAPSRAPTVDGEYDSFIPITFVLHHLTNHIKSTVSDHVNTSAISHLQKIIERGLFDDQFLLYAQFAVYIDKVNDVDLEEVEPTSWYKWGKESDPLRLESHIDCSKDLCVFITTYDMKSHDEDEWDGMNDECNAIPYFQLSVQCNMRRYFDWDELGFTVDAAEAFNSDLIECYDCGDSSFDYLLTGIFGFLGLMTLLSILAFLYNNQLFCTLPGFSPVDDAKWMALMIFGIQAWDFISDVNLAIEIWDDLNGNGIPDELEENAEDITLANANIFIVISGAGATFFVVIPYVVNIIIAANIKKMIASNDAAKAYFQYYAAVFVSFVVLSGGAYPALAVVSSQIFGLAVFNSGLTAFELRALSKIKLFGTIILENLPQIGCQILYSWTIGNFTRNTQLAFCASLLSVTASTLSYYIERNAADTMAISYYLSFECKGRAITSHSLVLDEDISPYDVVDATELETMRPKTYDQHGGQIVADHTPNTPNTKHSKLGMTDKEKENFWRHKGMKLKLSTSIAQVFGISENNIEIGYVQITKYGIILHAIQFVYSSDLEALERELSDEQINMSIGPSYYTEHCLYGSFTKEIDDIFANHFEIETNDFGVKYHKRYPIKKRKSQQNMEDQVPRQLEKKKSSIVHGMAMHLKKMQTLNNPMEKNEPDQIKRKLNEVVTECKFSSNEEENQFLAQWMKERNGIYDVDDVIGENEEGKEADDSSQLIHDIVAQLDTLRLQSVDS